MAPRRSQPPPRRSGLRAGFCATLLATASGLRLPSFTDATAKLLAAAGKLKGDGATAAAAGGAARPASYPSELVEMPGHTRPELLKSPLPHTYVTPDALPSQFSWGDVNGVSFLTRALNQHVPQYCGSCWAHATASVLADRIKIARGGRGVDIGVSIQWLLNCGAGQAGSCHGGSTAGAYDFIERNGFIPFDTCLAYEACSSDSTEGKCGNTQGDYSCTALNTCRTCSTFAESGGFCSAINVFPNATVAEYGRLSGEDAMQREIFARGPIACSLNAVPLHTYTGGVMRSDEPASLNHAISIVGWGTDPKEGPYWIGRNSWGHYWGEMGFFRLERGNDTLGVESRCVWATPGSWTEINTACYEDGTNCVVEARYPEPGAQPEGLRVAHGARALLKTAHAAAKVEL